EALDDNGHETFIKEPERTFGLVAILKSPFFNRLVHGPQGSRSTHCNRDTIDDRVRSEGTSLLLRSKSLAQELLCEARLICKELCRDTNNTTLPRRVRGRSHVNR